MALLRRLDARVTDLDTVFMPSACLVDAMLKFAQRRLALGSGQGKESLLWCRVAGLFGLLQCSLSISLAAGQRPLLIVTFWLLDALRSTKLSAVLAELTFDNDWLAHGGQSANLLRMRVTSV